MSKFLKKLPWWFFFSLNFHLSVIFSQEPNKFEILEKAGKTAFRPPTLTEIFLTVVVILTLLGIFVGIPYWLYQKYKEYIKKKTFFQLAKNYNLTEEEAQFLWDLAKELKISPNLLISSHALFQRAILKYIKNHQFENIHLISSIRNKLGFTKIPEFVPISSTLDIDVYQPVTVIVGDEQYEATVIENTEQYWAIGFMSKEPQGVKEGDEIMVTFNRPGDGRYIIVTKVLGIERRDGKLVFRLEHTDEYEKIQLRAHVRWPVNIPCKFAPLPPGAFAKDFERVLRRLKWHEGVIRDISAGGIRLCSEYYKGIEKIKEGSYVIVDFTLEDTPFENIICEVRRVIKNPMSPEICFGMLFVYLPKELQQRIQKYIWDEQRRIIRLYKESGEF